MEFREKKRSRRPDSWRFTPKLLRMSASINSERKNHGRLLIEGPPQGTGCWHLDSKPRKINHRCWTSQCPVSAIERFRTNNGKNKKKFFSGSVQSCPFWQKLPKLEVHLWSLRSPRSHAVIARSLRRHHWFHMLSLPPVVKLEH